MTEEGGSGSGSRKVKVDRSGAPFAVKQRGGKRQKKADLRAELTAGEREPQESWSEAKRDAHNRLQALAARRRELAALEKQAREDFRAAAESRGRLRLMFRERLRKAQVSIRSCRRLRVFTLLRPRGK